MRGHNGVTYRLGSFWGSSPLRSSSYEGQAVAELLRSFFWGSSVVEQSAVNLFFFDNMRKEKRTYAMRADYLKAAVAKRRRNLRMKAIAAKGGKCEVCGYSKCMQALEFHHVDPNKKEFSISADGSTRSWIRIQAELDKCYLLCANCHREIHAGITQLFVVRRIEK